MIASKENPKRQRQNDEEEHTEENDYDEEDNLPKRRKPVVASALDNNSNYSSIMCQKCRWRKNNSACDLNMCLTCCVDSNRKCSQRSHVSTRATKQKMLALEQQAATQPRIEKPHTQQQQKRPPLAPIFVNPHSPAPARFPTAETAVVRTPPETALAPP